MTKQPSRRKKLDIHKRDYTPHEGLINHMKDFLHMYQNPEDVSAGEENNIRHMKNYYLPLLFQAMADLTFFFESISVYPELRQEFKLQTMDLLGVRRDNPRNHKNHYGFMFENLIGGMLTIGSSEDDFRVRLIHILEGLIWLKVSGLNIFGTLNTSSRVLEDIGRPIAWTEMLASKIDDVYDFDILNHGLKDQEKYPYGGTERQRNKAFDDDAFQKRPARTFTFNTEELLKN